MKFSIPTHAYYVRTITQGKKTLRWVELRKIPRSKGRKAKDV